MTAGSGLAFCLTISGELAEAVHAFETCVRLRPDSQDAWLNFATTHWSNGNRNQAKDAFNMALKLDPTSTLAQRGMVALAIDSGDASSADHYLQGLSSGNWDLFYNLAVLQQSHCRMPLAYGKESAMLNWLVRLIRRL
jgi:cytochrome c-type biogenesis protein CcmH/NrfG